MPKTKRSRPRRQSKPQHLARHKARLAPAPAPTSTAITRHPTQERTLRPAEIDLLKKTVAKNCTDEEFSLFMLVCKKKKLDPFTKQVYCIKWPRRNQPDEMVIIVGIGGYRSMAARSHRKDFGGTSAPTWTFPTAQMKTPAQRLIPETCTVTAKRRSGAEGSATVFWEEFAPPDLTDKRSDFWNRMPKHMLAKCAEALALRKVFPDLSDIYSEEEMSQRLGDLTPGGREVSHGGVAPSGKQLDEGRGEKHLKAQEIAAAKQRGDWCEKHSCLRNQCPADEHTSRENDEVWNRQQASRTIDVEAKSSDSKEARSEKKSASPGKAHSRAGAFAGATALTGTVHSVIHGMTKEKHVPYLNIKVNGVWYTCWSKTLQEFFKVEADVVSRVVEFYLDKSKNIDGLKRIGNLYFESDGRTPIRREPGDE